MKFKDLPSFPLTSKRKLEIENAKIKHVSLTIEDHGCLSGWLSLEIGSCSGCGFGGYKLASDDEEQRKERASQFDYCAEFIIRSLQTVGVSKWEDLAGQPLRVLTEGWGGSIVAIGNFLRDEWFCPEIEFGDKECKKD